MMEVILLGILGSVGLAALVSGGDNDDSNDIAEDDFADEEIAISREPLVIGIEENEPFMPLDETLVSADDDFPDDELTFSDDPLFLDIQEDEQAVSFSETLFGSTGDDDIRINVSELSPIQEINLGEGDDSFSGRGFFGDISVFGGEGDDVLAGSSGQSDQSDWDLYGGSGDDDIDAGTYTQGFGDDGNDTLTGRDGSSIYGGEGNDTLDGPQVDNSRFNLGRAAYGGVGDDTLNINRTAGGISNEESNFGEWQQFRDLHYGGEGSDTFSINLDVLETTLVNDDVSEDQGLLHLSDFVAGEDTLDVELSRPITSVEIINEADLTRVEFTFEADIGDADQTLRTVTSYITLGDPNVTADDIIITGAV